MTPDFYTRKEKSVCGGDSMSQRIGGSWVEQGRRGRKLEGGGATFTFDAGPSLSIASGQASKMRARAGPAHPRSRLQALELHLSLFFLTPRFTPSRAVPHGRRPTLPLRRRTCILNRMLNQTRSSGRTRVKGGGLGGSTRMAMGAYGSYECPICVIK